MFLRHSPRSALRASRYTPKLELLGADGPGVPGDERDGVAVAGDVLTFALVATCAADAATGAVSCGDCSSADAACTLADNFNWTRWTQRYAAPAMAAAAADNGDEAAAAAARAGALARGAAPFDAAAISIVLGDAATSGGYANCTGVRFNRTRDDPSAGTLRCTLAEDRCEWARAVSARGWG